MRELKYTTKGTCSRQIVVRLDGGKVARVRFVGGCPGNTQGVAALAKGRKITEVIAALKGIQCHHGTSCPDQLAQALEAELAKK
jgi:uncharacterized protein (TIGR03905 family)